jgi:prepilin-type N-terminal cleavage/methylation domain-containing protein
MKAGTVRMCRGFTLVEMLISLALAAIIIPVILAAFGSISTSLWASQKYTEMHHDARRALDRMRKDIANGSDIVSYAQASRLELTTGTNNLNVTYALSGTNLTRDASGVTETLATGVSSVAFELLDEDRETTTDTGVASAVDITLGIERQGVRQKYADILQARVRLRGKL